ncbi:MAG: hypothetical protein KBD55_02505 [Candidatus Pacebacteria bacterium]|nr:hypothetical protein [Candidatus Paceibacterota bacterium]
MGEFGEHRVSLDVLRVVIVDNRFGYMEVRLNYVRSMKPEEWKSANKQCDEFIKELRSDRMIPRFSSSNRFYKLWFDRVPKRDLEWTMMEKYLTLVHPHLEVIGGLELVNKKFCGHPQGWDFRPVPWSARLQEKVLATIKHC